MTFTDSETPATFHRGVTLRKSFKKFAKPFQIKKLERLSSEKGETGTNEPSKRPLLSKPFVAVIHKFHWFSFVALSFPGGLVARIRGSHPRGPGSIPGPGVSFCTFP